ncbi:LIC11966 family surface protein [Chitinophaga sp.]|uniref:LIC11966 family surface protein n=1 Tax=Chitinophaga sp. TaxID=1869181 RepID=UPI002F925B7F
MKKVKAIFAPICIAAVSTLIVSCGSSLNPVEYNNKLMSVMNEQEKHMNEMNSAMVSQDFAKAESVRKTWAEQLDKSITEVNKIETINEDGGLKPAVEQGLKEYKKIADEGYKELIGLRVKEKGGDTTVQPQIQATLNRINQSFDAIGGNINKASDAFEKKHSGH